jgi:dephospho-CoA kinase
MFAALGAGVVDTDVISRELTGSRGSAIPEIERAFGAEYVMPDGSLDRARMRTLVFADSAAKQKLEAILHPRIRDVSRQRIAEAREPYLLIVVPLLLETGAYRDLVDRVLVVDCTEEQQIKRTAERSGLPADEVRRIMRAQLTRAERLKLADDVLSNDGTIEALEATVTALHQKYLAASTNQR